MQGPHRREGFWDPMEPCSGSGSGWSSGVWSSGGLGSCNITGAAGLGRETVLVLSGDRRLAELGVRRPSLTVIMVSGGCRQRPAAGLAGSEPGAKVILGKASTLISFTRTSK